MEISQEHTRIWTHWRQGRLLRLAFVSQEPEFHRTLAEQAAGFILNDHTDLPPGVDAMLTSAVTDRTSQLFLIITALCVSTRAVDFYVNHNRHEAPHRLETWLVYVRSEYQKFVQMLDCKGKTPTERTGVAYTTMTDFVFGAMCAYLMGDFRLARA